MRDAQTTVNATSLGTVSNAVGKGGSIDFIPSNLMSTDRRLVVILKKADGTQEQVVCSQIREQKENVNNM